MAESEMPLGDVAPATEYGGAIPRPYDLEFKLFTPKLDREIIWGSTVGAIKGDTRSLDHSSCRDNQKEKGSCETGV